MYADLTRNCKKYGIKSLYDNNVTWANQVRILNENFKNLGKVLGGIGVNSLKPLIGWVNKAIIAFTNFAKVISDSLGTIFGWQYEESSGAIIDVSDAVEGLGDEFSDATSGAKKLKNAILGFDELNIINKNNSASASGGSVADILLGTGEAGSWKRTEPLVSKYTSDIDNLFKLGRTISDKLSSAMESIDWDSIYAKARNFGSGLASFLNGLITPRVFGDVSKTIANSLNTAVQAALEFGRTFDFKNLGESLAAGVNNFFRTFNFGDLGKAIDTWVRGLSATIKTFLKNVTWRDVLKYFKDFFSNISLETISIAFALMEMKYLGKLLTAEVFKDFVAKTLGFSVAQGLGYTFIATALISVGIEFTKDAKEWINNIKEYGWDEGRKVTAENNSANPYKRGVTASWSDILSSATNSIKSVSDMLQKGLITNIRIPKFATGGFPEDGLFMANRSELVGSFSNGRTAVANNAQIIDGIKQGVMEAMIQSQSLGGRGGSVVIPVYLDGREVGRATANSIDDLIRGGSLKPQWI